jgi:hypothetical protein
MLPPREIFKPEKETTLSKGQPAMSLLAKIDMYPSRLANPKMQALRNKETTPPLTPTKKNTGRKDGSCVLRIED